MPLQCVLSVHGPPQVQSIHPNPEAQIHKTSWWAIHLKLEFNLKKCPTEITQIIGKKKKKQYEFHKYHWKLNSILAKTGSKQQREWGRWGREWMGEKGMRSCRRNRKWASTTTIRQWTSGQTEVIQTSEASVTQHLLHSMTPPLCISLPLILHNKLFVSSHRSFFPWTDLSSVLATFLFLQSQVCNRSEVNTPSTFFRSQLGDFLGKVKVNGWEKGALSSSLAVMMIGSGLPAQMKACVSTSLG